MTSEPLLLTRRDPTRNMARFYVLNVEPDLFNGAALTRNWGRIGTKGRFRIDLFESRQEAERRFLALVSSKVKRGYRQRDETG
ncbi:WGR domain-containing protein [Neorhizobium galegae]|uniref:WGR domain-containing protein n=1 Tax=Neorhizobium galegae TaxID=399 RepID=UPI000627B6E8|nr:WGR domain-containing protein [Neorhizobium galegae]MCM2500838.1 WGR domain-containing protein [Neorhizobium galegae]MCQ1768339.1 WGR domain-containing protein [Neorhizobium galegae]MCQ1769852.1 WGR domain-containing protein [Neorhizobium galegae]MCQ1776090.1 WGR domain-containing protein [Neorhizobium galegae]MCQ1799902.1 WGR domain-containing protein [Neorhizobium galegae]